MELLSPPFGLFCTNI